MVTPTQILTLAEELAERDDEAAIRCAISRAYYAAFLHCRIWLEQQGQSFGASARQHGSVHNEIATVAPVAGERLRYLRRRRNNADYDVTMSITPDLARYACATARDIFASLDDATPGTAH